MTTHVVGFRPPDEKWKQMRAVWDTCHAAGMEPPKEVLEFFDHVHPGDAPGQEVGIGPAVESWGDDYRSGYEIILKALPKDITVLRFYNSY